MAHERQYDRTSTETNAGTHLDSDLDLLFAFDNAHDASTVKHGATGAVVGTTNTQILTNKTITSPIINTATIASPTITGVISGDVHVCSRTIMVPEYAQAESDFIPLLPIESGWAPYGIQVTKFGIKLDANRAYSVVLEDWSDPATASADISTVATGAGEMEKESGALTTTVAAGEIVGIDLPTTTGAKFLMAWFTYIIKAS